MKAAWVCLEQKILLPWQSDVEALELYIKRPTLFIQSLLKPMIEVLSMKMSKFYEVSKVLDRRTDTNGRVQYLVRWAGYSKAYDSLVDEEDTNDHLKQAFRTRFQSNLNTCLLYTSPSPRDQRGSRMPSSA